MKTPSSLLLGATLSAVVLTGVPSTVRSQTTRSYVQVMRLKPDMVNTWLELQEKEVIPAQKKAGVTGRTTLVTQVGNSFEYLILTPFPKWEAMDGEPPLVRALGADGAAKLNAKLRQCVLTQQSYMTNRQDSLTIGAGDALVWRTAIRRILPGKMGDYLAFYRAEVHPAMLKAKAAGKIAGATVAVRGAGAQSGEFTTVTYYAKFADLDGGDPVVGALGQAEGARINAKTGEFATNVQVVIRRRLANLSF